MSILVLNIECRGSINECEFQQTETAIATATALLLFELQISVSERRVKARADGVNVVLNTLLIDERHSKGQQLHSALNGEVQAKLTLVKAFANYSLKDLIYPVMLKSD